MISPRAVDIAVSAGVLVFAGGMAGHLIGWNNGFREGNDMGFRHGKIMGRIEQANEQMRAWKKGPES